MKLLKVLFILFFFTMALNKAFAIEQTLKIKVGRTFHIELESNPTTGYQWQLAQSLDKKIIELVSSYYITPKTNLIGAGNKEIWVFRAIQQGETEILFKYVRPWEDSKPEMEKTYIINIIK